MRLTESIVWISGAPYGMQGSVYALQHENGVILVDCGEPGSEKVIDRNLHIWLQDAPVTHILLTHAHVDHAGTAAYYRARGAKIICSAADVPALNHGGFTSPTPFEGMDFPSCQADIVLEEDGELELDGYHFQVYMTPGHTAGSSIYRCEIDGKTVLFTGDTVSCDGSRGELSFPCWAGDPDFDRTVYTQSLAKIFLLKADMLLGGHGIPCFEDPSRTIGHTYAETLRQR